MTLAAMVSQETKDELRHQMMMQKPQASVERAMDLLAADLWPDKAIRESRVPELMREDNIDTAAALHLLSKAHAALTNWGRNDAQGR